VAGNFGNRTINTNQIARIYFGAPGTSYNAGNFGYGNQDPYYNNGAVYGNYGADGNYGTYNNNYPAYGTYNDGYGNYGTPANTRTITIPGSRTWTNTGVDVRRGDVIHFRASGNMTLSTNQSDVATPAGSTSGRMAGNSPLPGVTGGMLIGRVGNGLPFAVGAEADVTMPANGRLFLGVNDDDVRDNVGSFVVEIWNR
jgi:hypothetical protein